MKLHTTCANVEKSWPDRLYLDKSTPLTRPAVNMAVNKVDIYNQLDIENDGERCAHDVLETFLYRHVWTHLVVQKVR